MIVCIRWNKPWDIKPFKWWLFHKWCDYWDYHKGMEWDGMRILGFDFHNYDVGR